MDPDARSDSVVGDGNLAVCRACRGAARLAAASGGAAASVRGM